MNQVNLAELSDEELLQEAERMKPTRIYDAVIIGVLIGISVYSSTVNGFGLLSYLPVVYLPISARNATKRKKLKKLLEERNVSQANEPGADNQ